jgi:hypothetical protein
MMVGRPDCGHQYLFSIGKHLLSRYEYRPKWSSKTAETVQNVKVSPAEAGWGNENSGFKVDLKVRTTRTFTFSVACWLI